MRLEGIAELGDGESRRLKAGSATDCIVACSQSTDNWPTALVIRERMNSNDKTCVVRTRFTFYLSAAGCGDWRRDAAAAQR